MEFIDSIEALEALYGEALGGAVNKVRTSITPLYHRWIEASRFCILSTVGPEGTDASPRGDVGPVVRIADSGTLLLPDWRGNNRIDSLRNIVRDGRVSLMFMIHGCDNVIRVNGHARLCADPAVVETFEQKGRHPRSVIVVSVQEVYFQCAKALMRSRLWSSENAVADLPTAGQFLKALDDDFDAETYDADYPAYAEPRMW